MLIFPEGRRTPTGQTQPFREGIGLIATALRVPVIPVSVDGLFDLVYHGALVPRPGQVTVRFGAPITFRRHETYHDIASAVERAVRELGSD